MGETTETKEECRKRLRREGMNRWRAKNPEKSRERTREASRKRRADPVTAESIRGSQARYRASNADKIRESGKRYREANGEKAVQSQRRCRAQYKEDALSFARDLLAGKYPNLNPADHAPYLVYTAINRRILKATDRPLYIGSTDDWEARRKQHARTVKGRCWLAMAEDVKIDVFPGKTLARAAEALAIAERRPLFNDLNNDDPDMRALR